MTRSKLHKKCLHDSSRHVDGGGVHHSHCQPHLRPNVTARRILWSFCALILSNDSKSVGALCPAFHTTAGNTASKNTHWRVSPSSFHILTATNFPMDQSTTTRLHFSSPTSSCSDNKDIFKYSLPKTRTSHHSQLEASRSSNLDKDNNEKKKQQKFYVYKDDCFGFITFLAGIASQDFVFTTIFVSFSLGAEVLARSKVLPPDPKRPSIVDRKVAGAIAVLTVLLTTIVYSVAGGGDYNLLDYGISLPQPPPDTELAQRVQLALCTFSAVTAFGDIRWRDRFDYGPDDQV